MRIEPETTQQSQIAYADAVLSVAGFSLRAMASGVLILALSRGDLNGFLTR